MKVVSWQFINDKQNKQLHINKIDVALEEFTSEIASKRHLQICKRKLKEESKGEGFYLFTLSMNLREIEI